HQVEADRWPAGHWFKQVRPGSGRLLPTPRLWPELSRRPRGRGADLPEDGCLEQGAASVRVSEIVWTAVVGTSVLPEEQTIAVAGVQQSGCVPQSFLACGSCAPRNCQRTQRSSA